MNKRRRIKARGLRVTHLHVQFPKRAIYIRDTDILIQQTVSGENAFSDFDFLMPENVYVLGLLRGKKKIYLGGFNTEKRRDRVAKMIEDGLKEGIPEIQLPNSGLPCPACNEVNDHCDVIIGMTKSDLSCYTW